VPLLGHILLERHVVGHVSDPIANRSDVEGDPELAYEHVSAVAVFCSHSGESSRPGVDPRAFESLD
jgi:hypothetical protein